MATVAVHVAVDLAVTVLFLLPVRLLLMLVLLMAVWLPNRAPAVAGQHHRQKCQVRVQEEN